MSPEIVLLGLRLAAAAGLYAFLILILVYLRRDFLASVRGRQILPEAHLEFLEDSQLVGTKTLTESNEIGRAGDNSIVLDDETVSAHHARISYHGGQWWLEDLASRNGTLVNGIPADEPLVVTTGDEIQFGRVKARLLDERGQARTREEQG